jgi:16S rRNA processing protein RimM
VTDSDGMVLIGRVSGLFGVTGWVKVYSYTQPRANVIKYGPWYLRQESRHEKFAVSDGKLQGKSVIAKLAGVDDRDLAAGWVGADILISREQFDAPEQDEYYWTDLVGMKVQTELGVALGTIERLLETGANDVLVVEGTRRRMIPFLRDTVIKQIDFQAGLVIVDWDPDF